jgi:N-acetylmuramoyl-L-alanine amidase
VKRFILFFGIFCCFQFNVQQAYTQITIKKVVIDAGHGGHDPGAMGKNSREKDIALSIALRTGKYIQENIKDVQVIYTRSTDTFIELYKRAQVANENKADLFISIHCNSSRSIVPYGAETYVMGLHKTQDNLEVAKTENSAIFQEDNYANMYEGFNPNSDEDYVTLSLFQHAFQEQSIDMAMRIQDQFRETVNRFDRGVKQAGFLVLYKTTMPCILVETGFLSNPKEERFLQSEEGQDYIATAIYRAFKEYKQNFEQANQKKPIVIEKQKPPKPHYDIFFRIQFATYTKPKPPDYKKFKGVKDLREYHQDGLYKYTSGNERTLEEAGKLKEELLKKGFKDVFIVAFLNGERITLDEARKLLKESE